MKKLYLVFIITALLTAILFAGCGSKNLTAKEGEPANGFLWENNYSEITITGYQGASNDIKIPDKINGKPVTTIENEAFSGFKALNSVTVPGTVKTMTGAFKNCENLTEVEIENGVENISSAFPGCISLTDVKLPDSVKKLNNSFSGCTSLKEISVPNSVEELSEAFSGCSALETVNIPTGATELSSTFSECISLKAMEIPENITLLTKTFYGCTALTTVTVTGNIDYMGGTFAKCTSLDDVRLNGIVKIFSETFFRCSAIKTIKIPDGVEELDHAFSGCSSLEELVLPKSFHPDDDDSIYSLLGICNSNNLKRITASKEMEELMLKPQYDIEWSLCEDTQAEWYKDLIRKASELELDTCLSYERQLTNGDIYKQVDREEIEPYIEDAVTDGLITTQKIYFPAYRDNNTNSEEKTLVVICATEIKTKCVRIGAGNLAISINGTEYPVYKFN